MYGCGKDCLNLIPFRLPQISCFTLSLKCFSSDSDNFPDVGIRPLLQFLKDTGSIPGWRRFCGVGNGNPLQCPCLENSMDRGTWQATVLGVSKSPTRLSDFTFTFHFHALEKEMATHSSVLAWRIPGTGEPVGLPTMGSHRVGHD